MKRYIIPFWIIIILLSAGYAYFSLKAPARKLAEWKNELSTGDDSKVENKRVANDKELKALTHSKIFMQNQLEMAKSDSISLLINLRDSTVSIELKGVTLHAAKIESYLLPAFFSAIDINSLNKAFSSPLLISWQESNVAKMPLTIKKAPKSPDEVPENVALPDTALNIPVFVNMGVGTFFTISFKSIFTGQEGYNKIMNRAKWNERIDHFKNNIGSMVKGKVPNYTPNVEIYMQSPDIVEIYRAIPTHPEMAFLWP